MAFPNVLSENAFSMTTLTDKVSKGQAVNTQLARFFDVKNVNTTSIQVDMESGTITLLETVARGQLPTHVTGARSRTAKTIGSVKIGTMVELTAQDINDVRQFGEESLTETFQSILDPRLEDATGNLDATHENLRAGAFRGIVYDSDGTTPLANLYTLFGLTAPAVIYLDLESITDLGALRGQFDGIKNGIRDSAGKTPISGFVAIAGRGAYQTLVNHAVVREAFDRWQDGVWLRGDNGGGFVWQGVEIFEYLGSAIEDDEILFAPKTKGLFKTYFTSPDEPELAGTLGRPVYVIPQPQDSTKSWSAEVSSFPIHMCSRPDLLRVARIGEHP